MSEGFLLCHLLERLKVLLVALVRANKEQKVDFAISPRLDGVQNEVYQLFFLQLGGNDFDEAVAVVDFDGHVLKHVLLLLVDG